MILTFLGTKSSPLTSPHSLWTTSSSRLMTTTTLTGHPTKAGGGMLCAHLANISLDPAGPGASDDALAPQRDRFPEVLRIAWEQSSTQLRRGREHRMHAFVHCEHHSLRILWSSHQPAQILPRTAFELRANQGNTMTKPNCEASAETQKL